ncbi:MAG: sulfite exporter TauE/SafE family protein [Cytophagales bacterium]
MYSDFLIPLLLLIVAFLYSSVGHGGASGYLAVLSLFSIAPTEMKSTSLILNIIVSLLAFYHYYRAGYFDWRLFAFFAITSVPFSFLGSNIPISDELYKKLLGIILVFPTIKLMGISPIANGNEIKPPKLIISLLVGAIIGFLSGMLGIGGGILLSPLILLMGWAGMKQTAAISALFIFVNSMAGLSGLYLNGINLNSNMYIWIIVALIGGYAGSFFGSKKFDNRLLKYLLAFVLSIASLKLIFS